MSEIIQYGQAFAALENIRSGRFSNYVDDFLLSSTGELPWNFVSTSGTALGPLVAEAGHPGIVQMGSQQTPPVSVAWVAVTAPQPNGLCMLSDFAYAKFILRPSLGNTLMSASFGFTDNVGVAPDETQLGAYFSFQPGTSPNWRTVTRDGAGITANTSAVAYTVGTWYQLEIVIQAAEIDFYINGAVAAVHIANLPLASSFNFGLIVAGNDPASDKNIDVDFMQLNTNILAQRY